MVVLYSSDAYEYLRTVRDTFQDNREIYDIFLKVLKETYSQRIRESDLISMVNALLKGHPDLILGLNKFLPKCYTVTLETDETPPRTPVFGNPIDFLNKVKATLQDQRAFGIILIMLRMYRQRKLSFTEVLREVFYVLRDHPDLCEEFKYFLPPLHAYNREE